ncbi:MAG: ectoine/hydroxyectoine ABC transporter substrate-binding protein EhuB [Streptosporangiales bacterium]|nr:ectoine/hydroxyectoine ABC transporter substrate-binding protein EhuB [Streptosporangiales bacterium]
MRELDRRGFLARAGGLSLAVPLLGVAACSRTEGGTAAVSTLEQVKKNGVARLAIANEPPYTKIKTDGSVTGASPEVARAVLKRLGVPQVEGIVTPYDAMIPGLLARRWDLITAGLFMKKSRCAEVLYSDPDVVSSESLLVPKGNPKNLLKYGDIKADKSISLIVLNGGYEDGLAKQAGIPGDQLVRVKDARDAIDALKAERGHAFALPTLSLNDLVGKDDPQFDITEPIPDIRPTGAGAAFHKQDTTFRDAYNKAFREIKKSGEFAEILKPWGFSAEDAQRYTADQLCQNEG